MNEYPSWQYDEMKQVGKDYDLRHRKFRLKKNELLLESLRVKPEHVIVL
jgi:hypothetical protein